MDRDQLREALGYLDWIASVAADWPDVEENYALVAEAARLVADPDTLTIWWCEEHEASGNVDWCLQTLILKPKPWRTCRMVRMILITDALLEGPK